MRLSLTLGETQLKRGSVHVPALEGVERGVVGASPIYGYIYVGMYACELWVGPGACGWANDGPNDRCPGSGLASDSGAL